MSLLSQARAALAHGDKTTARALVADALRQNMRDPEAWLLMSGIVESPEQQRDCLSRVLAIDPTNGAARRGLEVLDARRAPAPPQVSHGGAAPALRPLASRPPAAAENPPAAPQAPAIGTPTMHLSAAPPAGGYPGPPAVEQPPRFAWQPPPPASPLPRQSADPPPIIASPLPGQPVAPAAPPAPAYATPLIDYGAYGAAPAAQGVGYQPAGYGVGGYAGVPPKGRSTGATVAIALLGTLVVVVCAVLGLSLLGRSVGPPPPAPKVSAQDRTTAMLNDMFTIMLDPRFLDEDTMAEAAKPLEQYVSRRQRAAFSAGFKIGFLSSGADTEQLREFLPQVQRIGVEGMRYEVLDQTSRKIVIRITSGNVVLVLKDGRWVRQPIKDSFPGSWTYVNEDGVWYLDDLGVLK